MNQELLHILQHSLGVDRYGQGKQYRDHFVAGKKDEEKCRELVELGYMTERTPSEITGNAPWFSVTQAGKDAVARESPEPPKATASAKQEVWALCSQKIDRIAERMEDLVDSKMHSGGVDIPDDMNGNAQVRMSEVLVCSAMKELFGEYRNDFTREQVDDLDNLDYF